jgi:hypothetical protein
LEFRRSSDFLIISKTEKNCTTMMFNDLFGNDYYGRDVYGSPYERYRREQEEKRWAAELERRRRMEHARREAHERAMARKLEEEEEYRRQLEREARELHERRAKQYPKRRYQPRNQIVRGPDGGLWRVPYEYESDDESEPVQYQSPRHHHPQSNAYQIVRGPDGLLYRVPVFESHHDDNDEEMEEVSEVPTPPVLSKVSHETVTKPVSKLKKLSVEKSDDGEQETLLSMPEEGSENVPPRMFRKMSSLLFRTQKSKKHKDKKTKKPRRRRLTIIVEDASDSEQSDLEELHSAWRNRRPPPGVLMEPVESYMD